MQLREYVKRGIWGKALDIIEKFRPSISEQQYLTVRVLLLEEKFKDLLMRGEVKFIFCISVYMRNLFRCYWGYV